MSRTFRLDKLVRDGIVPSMEDAGQSPEYRTLSNEERVPALREKLLEESKEGDLPDLLEVIETLAEAAGMTFEEIRQQQLEKRSKIGGFKLGTFVSELTLKDDDPWVEYYAAEPDRFPEVSND